MFDDSLYEQDEIPDLDIKDDDEGLYVGKVYATKDDCQIALATYAIKNMFHLQTRTKMDSFACTCSD